MRLTFSICLFCVLQSFAIGTFSQNVRLSINQKNISVESVIQLIEDKTDYYFMYSALVVDVKRTVDVQATNKLVPEILDDIFKGTDTSYKIDGRLVALSRNGEISTIMQQQKSISGKVTDSSGVPLPGVTVVIKGTTNGTTTDANGNYSLSNVPANATLIFSFVGMKMQEVAIGNKTSINITLAEETIGVDEVVVVGYGTQKKVNLTGAVDVVTSEALVNRSAPTVSLLLQGASPNLNISITGQGGHPGDSQNINIRGIGTISGNGAPLILVDGVEMNISDVAPDDIESISVLKDAASSAIYGSRAPFGVVLITTKKGQKNQAIRIQYNNSLIYSHPLDLPQYVDSYKWAIAYNQASANGGLAPVYSDAQVERIKAYQEGTYKHEYNIDSPPNNIFSGRWIGNANNDWPAILYNNFAFSQKHNVNLSGGDSKTQYYVSSSFYDQKGVWSFGNDLYKRYNVTANISSQVTDWFKFDLSTKYARSDKNYPLGQAGREEDRQWGNMVWGPMTPYHNADGTVAMPVVALLQGAGRDLQKNDDSWITLGAELQPVKGWKTRVTYNHNYQSYLQSKNKIPVPVHVPNGTMGNIGYATSGYESTLSKSYYDLMNVVSSYEKTLGDHFFNILVGAEQEGNNYTSLFGSRNGLITNAVPSISTANDLASTSLDDAISHWANQGIFGRFNYNYKEKYLIEFNGRYNGSSRFAPESRWGFFPSVSAGYNISKENFWTTVEPYVTSLKLRASYGSLGNQNVTNYLYLPTLPVNSNLGYIINDSRPIYAGIPGIISNNLTWETITTLNFGLDAGFLKNRLVLTGDWYNRVTSDMLGPEEELPAVLGTSAPVSNNAKLSTKGYEISLNWKDRLSSGFSYDLRFVLGDNKTTVLEYSNPNNLIDTYYPGKVIGEVWGYTTDKIMQNADDVAAMSDQSKFSTKWSPGDIAYKDLNGDSKINDGKRTLDNHSDLSRIGNVNPRYNIGISAGFTWKGFDFNMFWQGIGKRDYVPSNSSTQFWGMIPGGSLGSESGLFTNGWMMDYWRPADETNILGPNTDAYFPKPSWVIQDLKKNHQVQTRYIVSAAFLRLKNIQLGYTLPQNISRKLYLQKVRIYCSGENLLTLKKLPEVIDPEISITRGGSSSQYPLQSSFSYGVNLTF